MNNQKLFGGSHISHLKTDETAEFIKHFQKETNIILPEKNISNSITLNSGNINKLQTGAFALAIPNDLKIYVYFTNYKGKNRAFIICRKIEGGFVLPKTLIMNVDNRCDPEIFKGTLLEATRVYANDGRFFILVNDIILYCGNDVTKDPFITRLENVCIFLNENFYENFRMFPFRMQVVTPFDRLRLISQRISNLPYKISHITFVSQNSKGVKLLLPYVI